jgi:oligosaccharide repeat unit polymerase
MNNIDVFGGVMRVNPLLLTLNTLLIIHFFSSWYRSYRKTGWKLDYWNLTMFLGYFVPFLLMYPFAGSVLNVLAVGNSIYGIQNYINQAYLISFVGYVSMYLGKYIFDVFLHRNFINYFFILPIKNSMTTLFTYIVQNKVVRNLTFLAFCLFLFIVLLMAFKSGQVLNPRAFFQSDNSIRPIYNLMTNLSGIISSLLIVRIFVYNKLSDKIIFGIYLAISMFIGSRGAIVYPMIQLYTYYIFIKKSGKINLLKLVPAGLFMLFLVMYLDSLRDGDSSVINAVAKMAAKTFYGNSFSDLRDFAWVLSVWKGTYLYGKTYASAFISFIPSSFSDFRTQWGIGKVTATMVGFDPLEHPGLRPGLFGESFLNFGVFGVVFVGMILGYSYRYVDYYVRKAAATNDPMIAFTAGYSVLLIVNLPMTSGFFNIYSGLLVFLFLATLRLVVTSIKRINVT